MGKSLEALKGHLIPVTENGKMYVCRTNGFPFRSGVASGESFKVKKK